MKQNEVKIGGVYYTHVSGDRRGSRVQVLGEATLRGRRAFVVAREGTTKALPKARTAAALHENPGPWD